MRRWACLTSTWSGGGGGGRGSGGRRFGRWGWRARVDGAGVSLTGKPPQCYIPGERQCEDDDTTDFSTQEGHMRKLASLLLLVGMGFGLGGCASPAYTGGENLSRIARTWDYENKQMIEDI